MKNLAILLVSIIGLSLASCDRGVISPNDFPGKGDNVNTGEGSGDNGDNGGEVYWGDNAAYHIWFYLCDESGANILADDKDAIYDVEIQYENEKYRYSGDNRTRAAEFWPFAIRLNGVLSDCFGFGDFCVESNSKFTVTYGDNVWEVEQKSELNPKDVNGDIIINVKINGKEFAQGGPYTLVVE